MEEVALVLNLLSQTGLMTPSYVSKEQCLASCLAHLMWQDLFNYGSNIT